MDNHNGYSRGSPDIEGRQRHSTRDRDDDRSSNAYRERRRSPDRRRDRRRSRSPANIDRYLPDRPPRDEYRPGRDHEDSRRERRRSPIDRPQKIDRYVPGQDPPAILVNPMTDPMKLDFQVGFTWFAEWWRAEQKIKSERERTKNSRSAPRVLKSDRELREEKEAERPRIQAAYDEYKENLQKAQAQTFVRLHKSEDWFRERYDPEVRDAFRSKLMDFRKTLYTAFEHDLVNGEFDDFTLEGIYKSESNGLGGVVEKEEGETTAAAEVLQTSDLLPSAGGDVRDPMASQPTLLLKTVAPTVTREKLEAFAKEHLGEGEGGLYHLSLSDPNIVKKCHRMGWVMLNPETPSAQAEAMDEDVIDISTIQERALEKINDKSIEDSERGNFTVHCGVHSPPDAPRKKALWDLFSSSERIHRDLELATRLVRKLDNELGDEYFGVAKIEERVSQLAEAGKLQPSASQKQEKNADAMDEYEEGEEGMIEDDEEEIDDEDLILRKKKLDLLVEYLRRVYNFCFFCVFESDSVHELQQKCPGGHLRRPRASLTSAAKEVARASASGEAFPLNKNANGKDTGKSFDEDEGNDDFVLDPPVDSRSRFPKPSGRTAQQLQRAFNWVKTFEDKILQILEPENVEIKKLGGTPVEEGVEQEMSKFVRQEDVNKYRCKVPECSKLFKGTDFWRKHVESRHPDFIDNIRKEVELVNAYVLDPSHIAPSRSDASSNGHFPQNNTGMPTGTPRGFSLQSHLPMSFSMPGSQGMFMPGGWGPPGSATNPLPGMGMAVAGPVRSHGRPNGYRSNGPYARMDGRGGRQPSFSGRAGFEGGSSAIGPREATQGRTVRSYEDLDAASGPAVKGAELDY